MRLPGKPAATTPFALGYGAFLIDDGGASSAWGAGAAFVNRGDAMRTNAITMMGQRKPDEDARRKAMVRLNGMMFYSIGFASFLESTAPLDTQRLVRLSRGQSDVQLWLERVWLPQRAEHGARFRNYIEATWPEFEWGCAYEEFHQIYSMRSAARVGPPGLALEFIARCVNETALTVFYRTLARCADEPTLRALAADAARDHAAYFAYFRGLYDRFAGRRRAGLVATCRSVLATSRSAREVDVATAFHPLAHHWHGGWVFPELTYSEFLARLALLIKRHGDLGPVERWLFRPWLNPPRRVEGVTPAVAANSARRSAGPAPVLRAA
jgi:hypothetical protein